MSIESFFCPESYRFMINQRTRSHEKNYNRDTLDVWYKFENSEVAIWAKKERQIG